MTYLHQKHDTPSHSENSDETTAVQPVVPVRSPTARSKAQQPSDDWLQENVRLGKGMKSYVARAHLRIKDFDIIDLEKSETEMRDFLIGRRIPEQNAKWAVVRTLNIAADHQLERLRRERYLEDLALANINLERLKRNLDQLVRVLSKLPPFSKGKLNKIMVGQDWRHFDTEAFAYLIHAMMDALPKLSPACVAREALSIINEGTLRASDNEDPAVTQTVRTAPPAILDLWESIPAASRTQAEEGVRRMPSCKSATEFFRHLATMLAKSCPQQRMERSSALFGKRVATIWRGLKLHVGRAYYNGSGSQHGPACHYPSNFQRFCLDALAVIGDDSPVSGRQVDRLKLELQRKER
jgi:hypothetical protein